MGRRVKSGPKSPDGIYGDLSGAANSPETVKCALARRLVVHNGRRVVGSDPHTGRLLVTFADLPWFEDCSGSSAPRGASSRSPRAAACPRPPAGIRSGPPSRRPARPGRTPAAAPRSPHAGPTRTNPAGDTGRRRRSRVVARGWVGLGWLSRSQAREVRIRNRFRNVTVTDCSGSALGGEDGG